MAELFGLECIVTPIGFKYTAEIMTTDDVLVGGEEPGGIAAKGHMNAMAFGLGLVLLEYMAKTEKVIETIDSRRIRYRWNLLF